MPVPRLAHQRSTRLQIKIVKGFEPSTVQSAVQNECLTCGRKGGDLSATSAQWHRLPTLPRLPSEPTTFIPLVQCSTSLYHAKELINLQKEILAAMRVLLPTNGIEPLTFPYISRLRKVSVT